MLDAYLIVYGKGTLYYIMIKKIAFLTGGGDCAGINAFIAAAVQEGIRGYQVEFVGIRNAFEGACADVLEEYLTPLSLEAVAGLACCPSTILGSSRFNPFSEENTKKGYPQKLMANLARAGIDAILATGGNDTIKTCLGLSRLNFPVIVAPKSIDNDVSGTDTMLGYKTAVAFGTRAVRSTVESARTHRRISLVEIMGRAAGWLTLEIGMAAGADLILIPEKQLDLTDLCQRILHLFQIKKYVNIVVAEGVRLEIDDPVFIRARAENPVINALFEENRGCDSHGNPKLGGIGQILRRIIKIQLGLKKIEEVRSSDLGFSLRGLIPEADDLALGSRFGKNAVRLLMNGVTEKMVGLQGANIITVPLAEALTQKLVNWSDDELRSAGVVFK